MRGRYFLIIPIIIFLLYLSAKYSLLLLSCEVIVLYIIFLIYYLSNVGEADNYYKYYNFLCDEHLAEYNEASNYHKRDVYRKSEININKVLKSKNMGFIIAVLPFYIFIIPYKVVTFILNYLDKHLSI